MGGLFKKGYSAVREEKQRQDENREKLGRQLWRFFLSGDGDEAVIRFLTEEPINFYEHTVKVMRGGKERYDSVICTSGLGECSLCDSGDRPSFKGAFLIYDKRPFEYTDKNGKKQSREGQLRLYVQGARVLSQLDRLSERYGLTNRDYIITRSGSGTATSYMFDRTDDVSKLSETQIANMLPDKIRASFDGTMESLYTIVEEQLSLAIEGGDTGSSDVEEVVSDSKNLIGVDEDDEPKTRKTSTIRKKPMFKSGRKENSVKPLFKAKRD